MANTVIRLRRDNDYNYAKVKDKFIPASGEICLVDTSRNGLRAVCGDGKTPFGELAYVDDFIIKGYYSNNEFYTDAELTMKLPAQSNKIYIGINAQYVLYICEWINNIEYKYHQISGSNSEIVIPTATADTAGVLKLYDGLGQNIDGTMTQKAITDKLNEKVENELNKDEESLIFA